MTTPFDLESRLLRGKTEMFFETLEVTPEIMHQILSLNTHNRNISRSTVHRYKLDMEKGHWPLTAEAIVIDSEGVLQNGQHRGLALIAADATLTMTFCWGAPPAAFKVIDQGLKRSLAHVATLLKIPNASTVAAGTRLIVRYDTVPGLIWTGSNAETGNCNLVEFIEHHKEELTAAALTATSIRHAMPAYNQAVVTAASYLIQRDSSMRDEAELFWEALKTGENLSLGDVRLALRNRELSGYPLQVSNSWRSQMRLGIWLKAWNAYVEGKPMTRLVFSRKELPMPKVS